MIGALVFAGILFYGVLYSGVSSFSGDNLSVMSALRGKITATATPRSTQQPEPMPRVGRPGSTQGRMRP